MTKYEKIYNHIIENYINKLDLNMKIPNELDIAKQFNVSRMTVNKSINALVDEGYLNRIRGKGTYIKSKNGNTTKYLGELYSYSEDMQKRNVTPTTKIINYEYITEPSDKLKKKMKISTNEHIHKVVRLRFNGKTPLSLDYTYILAKFIPEINYKKMSKSMIKFYEEDSKIIIGYEDQNIKACIATDELSKLLQIKVGDPLLRIEGKMVTSDEEVFECSTVYYISDAYILKNRAFRPKKIS